MGHENILGTSMLFYEQASYPILSCKLLSQIQIDTVYSFKFAQSYFRPM